MARPIPSPAPEPWLTLDAGLDAEMLRNVLGRYGRLHIPGVLARGGAERLHRSLAEDTPWRRNTRGAAGNHTFDIGAAEAKPTTWRAEVQRAIEAQATSGFQYLFDTYPVSDEVEGGRRLGLACEAAYDLLNAPPTLDFLRRVTGEPRIAYVDAQATRYLPGHFLTEHDDDVAGKDRLFAYVLNLTLHWRADWGGLLLFLDGAGHVAEGYTPKFNALNLFRVPASHCVTQVASFAGASRYAITGWIRSRPPW